MSTPSGGRDDGKTSHPNQSKRLRGSSHFYSRLQMGPEPLVFPLAFIGLIGLVVSLTFIVKARGRSWLAIPLFAGVAFAAYGAQGADYFRHTVTTFLMVFGIFVIASAAVFATGCLLLLPFKPQLVRLVGRLGFKRKSPPAP